jgi:hypothetical protein
MTAMMRRAEKANGGPGSVKKRIAGRDFVRT